MHKDPDEIGDSDIIEEACRLNANDDENAETYLIDKWYDYIHRKIDKMIEVDSEGVAGKLGLKAFHEWVEDQE